MKKDKGVGPEKKGLPGGFFVFLVALVLIILTFQSLNNDKTGKVSFSYQLEHLINLDLTKQDENRTVSQNENLVTFSGKFKDNLSSDAQQHYEYLSLLNTHHQLIAEDKRLQENFQSEKQKVYDTAVWFLQISGYPIDSRGFVIVGRSYDTTSMSNAVVVRSIEDEPIMNLTKVQTDLQKTKELLNTENVEVLGKNLSYLVGLYRSPKLGIGVENYKQQLKSIDQKIKDVKSDASLEEKYQVYQAAVLGLEEITNELVKENNQVRLYALRNVRQYVEDVKRVQVIDQDIEHNQTLLNKARKNVANVTWFYNDKELTTRALENQDAEGYSQWFARAQQEWENFSSNKGLAFKSPDQPRNTVLKKTFKSKEPSTNYFGYIITLLPIALVGLILYFFFSRQMKGGGVGSSAMNFGKSPARLLTKEQNRFTFKDVAGAEESKEELEEIIEFLRDPQKFTALGARIPKGVLLVGPPGTGKTLLAKAVAGEAERPFFSISGSDFVEMFVGVGASRIRDLFEQAKKNAPCIIFMDEIDAVGRHRGAGIGGGHDEREQTLNQLLVEMDGFDTKEGVILMAATNRPDILDKALLRPGRFDRRVSLELPDVKGRYAILKVHARRIKIDPSVELMDVARNTPGASGADLENILNEAALLAARRGRSAVTAQETIDARDKVIFGKERRSLEMDKKEKESTAYHEAGHAMVGLIVENADPVEKVTIIPRGFSLGATHFMPKKNRLSYWKKEVIDQLAICMGGRAGEEIFLNDMSSGAQQDINQATKLARAMVCEWGMNDDLGLITYDERNTSGQYLGMSNYHEKSYSNETAEKIDKAVLSLVNQAHERARQIIMDNKDKTELMAKMLVEFETLTAEDMKEILEDKWDSNKKKERVLEADKLQKKEPPPLPGRKPGDDKPSLGDENLSPQQT